MAIALAGLIAAVGIGDWLVRRNTPDHTAAPQRGFRGAPGCSRDGRHFRRRRAGRGGVLGGTPRLRSSAEYITEAVAICDAATVGFHVATDGLSSTDDREAWYAAAVRYSEKALAAARAPLPKRQGQRVRFGEFHSVLRRQVEALRRVAAQPPATPRVPRDFRSSSST